MKFYPGNALFLLFLLIGLSASANDTAYVKFTFAAPLNSKGFFIILQDGINEYKIDPQNTQSWRGELFAPFGYILTGYNNSDTTAIVRKAFFKKGNSEVYLTPLPNVNEYYAIDEKSSVNIIPYGKLGGEALDAFIKDKLDTWERFIHENKQQFGRDNIVLQKAFSLSDSVRYKEVEFIRKFPDLYVSFWAFKNEIVGSNTLSPDSLMGFYNTVFPDTYKKSKAAEHLAGIIRNKIAIASSLNFPDFSAIDTKNNKVELSKLKGKYILIQLWASWCAPCVQEIPDLKGINEKYKDMDFKLISFSHDRDSVAFRKAVEKYEMNWTQIFGDDRLLHALAQVGIPQLYLVDKEGRTIYNSNIVKDFSLELLKKILSERLSFH